MIPGFLCQGGVFTAINGPGGKSIYGEKTGDENFILKHMVPGILSTATAGPSRTSSQVFIHTADSGVGGERVVSGKVKEGTNIVQDMERFGCRNLKTSEKIAITNCGQT